MNKIYLSDRVFDIVGDVVRRRVNPTKATLGTGSVEYSDFGTAHLKEWKDGRGGIGLKREGAAETQRLWWSEGWDCSTDNGLGILGPYVTTAGTFGATPIGILDFGGSTYAYANNSIKKWNTGTSAWDSKNTPIASPIDDIVVTDSTNTYAVISSASAACYTTDGTTWSSLSGMMGYMAVFDNRLCGFTGKTLYYSPRLDIDGSISNFNVAEDIGTPYKLFSGKRLTDGEPCLYLVTTNGLFLIDFYTQTIWRQEIRYPAHTYAGHTGMYWNGEVYVATGPGIMRVSPGGATGVGPDQDDGLPNTYQGTVYDMEGGSNWIVYCVKNDAATDKSTIFKRHSTIGGNQQIYTSAVNTAITCVHISPSSIYTNGRLWWGEGTGIKYVMFPDLNANPTQVSSYTYVASSGRLILPIFRPVATVRKVAERVFATTKGCDAGKYFDIYYRLNGSTSWETKLGSFATSPLPTALNFGSSLGTSFYSIQFGVDGVTDSSTATPELESLVLQYRTRPYSVYAWQFNVRCTQSDSAAIISALETIEDTATLVKFYPSGDANNSSDLHYVGITNAPFRWTPSGTRKDGYITVEVSEDYQG